MHFFRSTTSQRQLVVSTKVVFAIELTGTRTYNLVLPTALSCFAGAVELEDAATLFSVDGIGFGQEK